MHAAGTFGAALVEGFRSCRPGGLRGAALCASSLPPRTCTSGRLGSRHAAPPAAPCIAQPVAAPYIGCQRWQMTKDQKETGMPEDFGMIGNVALRPGRWAWRGGGGG
eukprot:281148-Chlamydomonas_euryale.AAC.1